MEAINKNIIKGAPELRIIQHMVELRAEENSRKVTGIAAKVNAMSQVLGGWFREIIEPGAFDGADMSDVVALKNHNFDLILARTLSGTLQVSISNTGDLVYEFEAPNTTTGNDLLEEVRRGDIQHSSFAFIADDWKWETDQDGNEVRRIVKFKKILDVSPVVNAAYLQTSVDSRSQEMLTKSLEEFRKAGVPEYQIPAKLREIELKIKRLKY